MGILGQQSEMIPVSVNVRSFGNSNAAPSEKQFRFNVFVNQKWTPYLMMVTLFNTVSGVNEFRDEATYRLTGQGLAMAILLNGMSRRETTRWTEAMIASLRTLSRMKSSRSSEASSAQCRSSVAITSGCAPGTKPRRWWTR